MNTFVPPSLTLDGKLLIEQLQQLGELGTDHEVGGRTRIALTDDERAGRDLVVKWMRELHLDVRIDRIGNIFGTLRSESDDGTERPLMMGSHIDTVKNAGALDGCYGVLAGLAVVRAFRRADVKPQRSITIGAFTNEEGIRYQPDMMGSLVYAGGLAVDAALNTVGIDGTRLGDELERIGYAGDLEPGSIVPHEYLELHIEQGPVLEAENVRIGVVENLQGISWQQVTVQGNANHAGTTPTRLRHDAGWVAAAVSTFLRELAVATGTTLATIGMFRIEPNVINVIPRKAVFTVDLRDPDEQRLQDAERRLAEFLEQVAVKEGVKITTERLVRFEPVVFDAGLADAIEASSARLGFTHRRMTSGAGHDAQMIARMAPAAMIFVPSRGGISHNPREHTDEGQLIDGANVLLDVVLNRLSTK
ncbi:Amidase, hydantoinase/carbamoylase family [Paraburkholderia piptadeniae]|uniref:Amidase, hydantoinase/carbamoylase family n=1 Tax=Paraburkholderia piptadeniae TaxID=1701573 RepID=A0A1N7SPL9_9BURK|nr:Zn-dependent hydrolase [Paraburkholderia piptadeniae]SIT49328.1 Amidase, hydantoinase/carbamoylase family [Paraburkholderia piptadeniae]